MKTGFENEGTGRLLNDIGDSCDDIDLKLHVLWKRASGKESDPEDGKLVNKATVKSVKKSLENAKKAIGQYSAWLDKLVEDDAPTMSVVEFGRKT